MKAKNIARNIINSASEPEIVSGNEIDLITALNFYACNYNSEKSKEYLLANPDFKCFSGLHQDHFKNYGFLYRILRRGFPEGKTYDKIVRTLESAREILFSVMNDKKDFRSVVKDKKPVVNIKKIQKIDEAGGIAEHLIDLIHENRNNNFSMIEEELKTYQSREEIACIEKTAKRLINRLDEDFKNPDAKTLYKTGFIKKAKSQLILLQNYCSGFKPDVKNVPAKRVVKRKPVSKAKMVSKVRFCETHPELGQGRGATTIIGAKEYFVFDGKYLRHYVSSDENGLQVKGTTISNYDDTLSLKKVVRKIEYIKGIVDMTKPEKRKLFNELKALKKPLNGRLNEECFLIF